MYSVRMSTPLVEFLYMWYTYSRTPAAMHARNPTELAMSAYEALLVNSAQIHGDCWMKMYRQKPAPSVATKPRMTTKPTECLTAALS